MRPKITSSFSIRLKRNSSPHSRLQTILIPKIGLWIDGKTFWIKSGNEKLIPEKQISVRVNQRAIHSKIKLFDIFVTNHNEKMRKLKIIVMHSFERFSQDDLTFFSPIEKVIYHLAKRTMYLVNGHMNGNVIKDYTVQPIWNVYSDKFWKCPNSGTLNFQPMAHGPSNSLFTFNMDIPGSQTKLANTWMIAGESKEELIHLNKAVLKNHTSFSI
ncbi:hypothetical protein HHO41_16250 [Bacillus sp. DNRA2]|uniref:hypothetical protein n=1 Tax=Bacillus sp. DNRA2 TaxID=2723053 RepID=UPI00145C611F|nr:hypothetical protein [Bacillus sp. DNRA2]NMD71851.1 hypothetical protein [Bacillus sp. DNRA2]